MSLHEYELKFQVPAAAVAGVEAAVQRGDARTLRLAATYFDTPDEALAARRMVLRLRAEDDRWVQTLKTPGTGSFERLEHEVDVGTERPARPDPALHADSPAGAALAEALGDSALQPLFTTEVTRLARRVQVNGAEVELAFDRGEIRAGDQRLPLCELEFELVSGTPAALLALAEVWCREHGLWLDPQSKSMAGRRLAGLAGVPAPVTAKAVPVGDGRTVLADLMGTALQQVLANGREVAGGTAGDGHVHQMRVGLRRLRTVLRELRSLPELQDLAPGVGEALAATFRTLGEDRDASALRDALAQELQAAGAPAAAVDWRAPRPDLPRAAQDTAFQAAIVALLALEQRLRQEGTASGRKALKRLARKRLDRLHERAARDGRRFESLETEARHGVRKRYKRLRYLAELVRPLFRASAVDRFVGRLKDLQDTLGRYQDAATGRTLWEHQAARQPEAWFGAGWFAAREEALAQECGASCRAVEAQLRPFWD